MNEQELIERGLRALGMKLDDRVKRPLRMLKHEVIATFTIAGYQQCFTVWFDLGTFCLPNSYYVVFHQLEQAREELVCAEQFERLRETNGALTWIARGRRCDEHPSNVIVSIHFRARTHACDGHEGRHEHEAPRHVAYSRSSGLWVIDRELEKPAPSSSNSPAPTKPPPSSGG